MAEFINTSYKQYYIVVSASADGVVLRPVDDAKLATYWREFLEGYIDEPIPEDVKPTIRLTQLPAEVLRVDAYVDYAIEYPRAEVSYGNYTIDISDRLAVNHPNSETPGLYALDFTISASGEKMTPIWRSWVSIEEPPVLRHIITPWNRENRIVADLNRQVIEPQFMEALYEAGVPIYNFQQANASAAVSQFAAMKYRDARAIVVDNRLFITGPRLPVGTEVTVNGITRTLGVNVLCPPFSEQDIYTQGDLVTYCGSDYYALEDIPTRDIPDPNDDTKVITGSVLPTSYGEENGTRHAYWLQGVYYDVEEIGLPNGEYELTSLWAVLDVSGYLFKMDLLRAFPVHRYWGHYDRKYFYDYAAGDLVSVVSDNVITLYQRNDTSIEEKGLEEAYRPGHYKNPHWIEVYSESNDTMLSDPIIKPYTNAANAIICKTCPAREEAFRLYAKLVDIPTALVDALGSKYSVLLWALLYRTRETFPGIKAAMNAIGMDINNLRRAYPSVVYSQYEATGGTESEIKDVYTEIAKVKEIAKSVKADKIWYNGNTTPTDLPVTGDAEYDSLPWIRYSVEGEEPDVVWQYDESQQRWVKFYKFVHIGSDRDVAEYDMSVNNRYYRADANLLERLASDCAVDLNDGYQRIDHNAYVSLSLALGSLLSYEIPIYIYFRLTVRLAAIGHARMRGISKPVILQGAWGGSIGLKLYPGKYFDFVTLTVQEAYPTVLYRYDVPPADSQDSDWTPYIDYEQKDGYRYFPFDKPVYIRLKFTQDSASYVFKVATGIDYDNDDGVTRFKWCWTSRYTIGCLGDPNSPGTDDYKAREGDHGYDGFCDATQMECSDSERHGSDIYLCKGMAAITLRIATSTLKVTAEALMWQYIFDDPDWRMDEVTPFAEWETLDGVKLWGCWVSDVASFRNMVTRVTSPEVGNLTFAWEGDTIKIGGGVPRFLYFWDRQGFIRGMIVVPFTDRMVLEGDSSDYQLKFTFEEAD